MIEPLEITYKNGDFFKNGYKNSAYRKFQPDSLGFIGGVCPTFTFQLNVSDTPSILHL